MNYVVLNKLDSKNESKPTIKFKIENELRSSIKLKKMNESVLKNKLSA